MMIGKMRFAVLLFISLFLVACGNEAPESSENTARPKAVASLPVVLEGELTIDFEHAALEDDSDYAAYYSGNLVAKGETIPVEMTGEVAQAAGTPNPSGKVRVTLDNTKSISGGDDVYTITKLEFI